MTAQVIRLPFRPRQAWPPPSDTSFDGCDVESLEDHPLRGVEGPVDVEPEGDDAA